jgi:ATP-dependent Clp endopeptidase proteolytic subunit ClpP
MIAHVDILGEIGWDTTKNSVQEQIVGKPEKIILHIDSYGGGVFEGYSIYNLIKSYGVPIETRIESNCMSIATLIALAGDEVLMTSTASVFMIHNPWGGMQGDAKDFAEAAKQLTEIKLEIMKVYKAKTGLSEEELSTMMDDESYLNFEKAKEFGFVDGELNFKEKSRFDNKLKAVAKMDFKSNKMEKTIIEKINEKFDSLFEKFDNVFKPKNLDMTLEDGTKVFINTDTEDGIVGAEITLVETGDPAPDGDHVLSDGRIITVEAGKVTAIADPASDSEMDTLKKENEALKQELEALKQAANDNASKVETVTNEFKVKFDALKAEADELKNTILGDEDTFKNTSRKQETKSNDPFEAMQKRAEQILNN